MTLLNAIMFGLTIPAGGDHFEASFRHFYSSIGWKETLYTQASRVAQGKIMPCLQLQGFNSLLSPETALGLASYIAF